MRTCLAFLAAFFRANHPTRDDGYGLVELIVGAILLLVFIWLVFALVGHA